MFLNIARIPYQLQESYVIKLFYLQSMEASNVASSILISSALQSCILACTARNDATQKHSDSFASASPRSASALGKQGPDVNGDEHVALDALNSLGNHDLSTSETFAEEPLAAVSLPIPPPLTEEKLGLESDEEDTSSRTTNPSRDD